MEYYSAIKRNDIGSFLETWMDLETVIPSEVSQKEKRQILHDITYIWNLKNSRNELIYKNRNRLTDIENKLTVTKGEVGERDKLGVWD